MNTNMYVMEHGESCGRPEESRVEPISHIVKEEPPDNDTKDHIALYEDDCNILVPPNDALSTIVKIEQEEFRMKEEPHSENYMDLCVEVPIYGPNDALPSVVKTESEDFGTSTSNGDAMPSKIEITVDTSWFKKEDTDEDINTLNTDEVKIENDTPSRLNLSNGGSSGLRVYTRSAKKTKSFSCTACSESFIKKSDLLKHTFNVHPCTVQNEYKTEIVDSSFSVADYSFIDKHRGSKKCGCVDCCTSVHKVEKPYQCGNCNERFTEENHLTDHLRSHPKKPYACTECTRSYQHKHLLEAHMCVHTGEKPFECDICKQRFGEDKALKTHLRVHAERQYKCEICNKGFAYKNNFNLHKLTHEGGKPYQCVVCQKFFLNKRSVTAHMRTHRGEKPYQCSSCVQSFTDKYDLDVHMRVHTLNTSINK